jgi:hypothetical protein
VKLWVLPILAALLAWVPTTAAAPPPVRPGAPVSAHAMVHTCCTPPAMRERIFAESKAMGARFIRVDVELAGIFEAGGHSPENPHWHQLDEVMELSRRYDLPVLGILLTPPSWVEPHEAGEFGRLAAQVAAHARHTIDRWEVLNEPDGGWAFLGTPEQYAHILRAAHDAIKSQVPDAKIALGAIMAPFVPTTWLERVFATPGADAARAFDIANVNLRGTTRQVAERLTAFRQMLQRHGFTGPVWVAEHGYSAEPAYQTDSFFRGGEAAQGAYLTESVLSLADAGADQVFVTVRDNLFGRFLSEGVVAIDGGPPYAARRKPAFAALRRLVDHWSRLATAYAERRFHEEAMQHARSLGAAARMNLAAHRQLAQAARTRLRRLRARYTRAERPHARARLSRRVARANRDLRVRRSAVVWARASAADYRSRAALHRQRALELAAFVARG